LFMALSLQGFSTTSAADPSPAVAPWAVRLPQMNEILRTITPSRGPRLLFIPFAAEGRREGPMTFLLTKALWASLSSRRDLQMVGERSAYEVLRGGLGSDVRSMAAAVDAAFVLSGRTAGEGSSLRLEIRLLWAVDGRSVWSQNYPLEGADATVILDDILAETARALGLRAPAAGNAARFLTGWSSARQGWPSRAALGYAVAYTLTERGPEERQAAEQWLHRALDEDPELAPAWTLLARLQRFHPPGPSDSEAGTKAETYVTLERALALDPHDYLAYLTLSGLRLERAFDLEGASGPLLRALQEQPMFTPSIFQASWLAAASGDLDAAVTLAERSAQLDPLDASDQQNAAQMLYAAQRLDEAMEHLEVARVLEAEKLGLEFLRSRILLARGDSVAAREVSRLDSSPGFRALAMTLTEYALGNQEASDDSLNWLIANESETFAFQIAQAHACRGELEDALHWLRTAIEQQDPGLITVRKEPCFTAWQDHPRMRKLVAEILPLPQGSQVLPGGPTTSPGVR